MIPPKGQQKKKKKKKTIFKKTHGHDFNCFVGVLSRGLSAAETTEEWSLQRVSGVPGSSGTLQGPCPGHNPDCRVEPTKVKVLIRAIATWINVMSIVLFVLFFLPGFLQPVPVDFTNS
ncbi:uncharacterized protein FOBCDRAFT_201618 [Fusarium oxysporum Fo47]|uniref:uncharacterized protein n=1 Tax=Fusarium oxysporum Fo47 TaxID=660027 RepID=UPI00286997BE|nr:uncharacterized protein FOBCDRAFT_201618 [Fusarium oxysporum Fo47]WJG35331.1 hypothetical protein FOBCDRAFT_201618 [Fusarium oxysporum Fo47]